MHFGVGTRISGGFWMVFRGVLSIVEAARSSASVAQVSYSPGGRPVHFTDLHEI